jgi:hypothetical protein
MARRSRRSKSARKARTGKPNMAGLRAYWANKRAAKSRRRSLPAAPSKEPSTMARKKTRRRSNRRKSNPFAGIRRAAKSRRRSRGGGGGGGGGGIAGRIRRASGGFVSMELIKGAAGGAVGMIAANQLAPRLGSMLNGAAGTNSAIGQGILKAVIGIAGGAVVAKLDKPAGAGFALGAVAEPIAGAIRSALARNRGQAAGVQGLAALGDIASVDIDDAYSGVSAVEYVNL